MSEAKSDECQVDRVVMFCGYGPLTIDNIIIGEFKINNRIVKRSAIHKWLQRKIKLGLVYRVGRSKYNAA